MAPERAITEGPIPKHAQLREILLKLIDDRLAPDAPIPSERELMAEHGVSRMTVREAIGQLVSEGKLYSVRGKGTFVAPPKVESQLHLASFTEDMRRRGLTPSTALLRAELADPPERVREALDLPPEGQAYHLERLRIADGTPMAFEDSWYDPGPLPDLLDKDLSGSLYTIFTDLYGLTIDSAEQTVWAAVADAADARMLGVRAGAPLLAFQRVSSAGRIPVEYTTSWYRGDRYRVHMSLDSSFTPAPPHH
ncbi:GntR family transcriptional regulator [Haloechinothrix salitolerans]|uniref:GntR family transcriptional regulator n=1 Tax=Haloechinothrix salitolerans TaxID=926830 RepID=A0ABW2BZ53_9PSEU